MIVFGVPIVDEQRYRQWAAPTIARHREPDSAVIEKRGYDSIQQPYNEILEEAGSYDDLEGVVLLHEDTRVEEPRLPEVLRWHFRDPKVGLVGAVGAVNASSMAWWEGTRQIGTVMTPRTHVNRHVFSSGPAAAEVIDGYLMIVSPNVARTVRFDERGSKEFHGYDVDFCFRVRARGYRIVVDELATTHFSFGGDPMSDQYGRAYARWQRTWSPARWPPEWRGSAPYGFFR